ncbi:hypothetical protein HPB50_011880 [Hyalomma asiaticum]|uniref:Uncharacterized protein n=1 Tax=Hyalomma asiaticum TaxID=266040 RepID=A0ACB7RTY0_HYAAI|nr:hypothetical protein HPB50_011880 [Hyalomma asiaticum]
MTQPGSTDQAGTAEKRALTKDTGRIVHASVIEQLGSAKDSDDSQHAGVVGKLGEAEHASVMEQPSRTEHAGQREQPGAAAPPDVASQPTTSENPTSVQETAVTGHRAPPTPRAGTGDLAKHSSSQADSLRAMDFGVASLAQSTQVEKSDGAFQQGGKEAENSQSNMATFPDRRSLHPTGSLHSRTGTSKASSPSLLMQKRDSLKALSTLLCTVTEPAASSDHGSRRESDLCCTQSAKSNVVVTLLLVLVVLTFGFLLYAKTSREKKGRTYCTTKGCLTHRALIEAQLDRSVDACHNFSAHVCNRWKPRKEFSDLSRSALSDMVMSWLSYLPKTLSHGMAMLPVGRKAAAMFNSCMTEAGSHVNIFKRFMRAHGLTWPEDPDENSLPANALFDLAFNWNVNLWFKLKILPDTEDSERRRIFMSPNNLMLLWKAVLNEIPKRYFRNVYTALFTIFANNTKSLPDEKQIVDVYNTLQRVFNMFVPSCPCQPHVPGLFTLNEVDRVSPIPVAKYLQDTLNLVLGIEPPITNEDQLLLSDLSLLTGVFRLIGTLEDRDIVRHLSWLFVQAYAAVADPTAVLLLLHGSRRHVEQQRPLFCALQVEASYELLVAALTSVAHFSKKERRDIDDRLAAISEVDPKGSIGPSWLSESSHKAFDQRTFGCLPSYVSVFPEIPAIEVAYAAFKRQLRDNDTQLSEELTEEKVFFITACMITCATTAADNIYGGDCNKAVMNFAPFAEAFQCAPGSKMNPEKKCTFFD